MKSIGRFFGRSAETFFATVGVLTVFGLLIGFAVRRTDAMLLGAFGWMAIVVTGLIGTPVHELGHYLGCRLFGLRVTEVALFRPVAGQADGVLGYVNFSYDASNSWQRLGCFFAGIAPLLFGAAVILLLLRLLTPEIWKTASASVSGTLRKSSNPLRLLGAAVSGYLKGLGSLRGFGIVRGLLGLYLSCSVAMHMSLSVADLKGALPGLLLVLLGCAVYSAVTLAFCVEAQKKLARTAAVLSLLLGAGLLFCLLCMGLSYLMIRIL